MDASPAEPINDMHRYRDAILYRSQRGGRNLSRQIVGAYVLYPGRPVPESYDYATLIRRENIGAIPLLPGEAGGTALESFIGDILGKRSPAAHLAADIPTRGTSIVLADEVPRGEDVLIMAGSTIDAASHRKFASGVGNHDFIWLPKGEVDRKLAPGRSVREIRAIIITPVEGHNVDRQLCFIGRYAHEWEREDILTFAGTSVPEGRYYVWQY